MLFSKQHLPGLALYSHLAQKTGYELREFRIAPRTPSVIPNQ
jgi:hypothetical protein